MDNTDLDLRKAQIEVEKARIDLDSSLQSSKRSLNHMVVVNVVISVLIVSAVLLRLTPIILLGMIVMIVYNVLMGMPSGVKGQKEDDLTNKRKRLVEAQKNLEHATFKHNSSIIEDFGTK